MAPSAIAPCLNGNASSDRDTPDVRNHLTRWCNMYHKRSIRKFVLDRDGTVAVMMGGLLPVIVAGLGLGFELSNWYLQGRAMQNAADSAVLAAATNGGSNYATEAKAVTAQLGFVDGANNVTVTASNSAACPGGGNTCYQVTISGVVPLYLTEVVGYSGDVSVNGNRMKTVSSAAVAKADPKKQPICLLGLSQTTQAVRTNGAPNSNFSGCTVMSDSASTCNGSNLNATFGLAHGTNNGCGNTQYSSVPVVTDPYSSLRTKIPPNTCSSYPQLTKHGSNWSGGTALTGTKNYSGSVQFCGDVQLTGDVIINTPDNVTGATIVIENGQLDLNGHTFRTSDGSAVTLIFSGQDTPGTNYTHAPTDKSSGQGGILNFQAPRGGDFGGIALYQDPVLTNGIDLTYTGNNPTWDLTGLVYLPNSNVQISGDVSKSQYGDDCFVMVANTILINGTSNIYQQSPNGSGCKSAGLIQPTAIIPGRAQLVY
jgi:Flp pilus assembly protein TadG